MVDLTKNYKIYMETQLAKAARVGETREVQYLSQKIGLNVIWLRIVVGMR